MKKVLFLTFLVPLISFAQLTKTSGLLDQVLSIVRNTLIPLAFTLAVLFFFWGLAMYIWQEGQKKDDGRKIMIWGVIALFVMSSIWGIVAFIQTELLGGSGPRNVDIPTIGGSSGSTGGGSGLGDI